MLVANFLKTKLSPRNGQPIQITREVMAALCAFDWPGNVRELENVVERAATLCDGNLIQAQDLPPALEELIPKPAGGAGGNVVEGEPASIYPLPNQAEAKAAAKQGAPSPTALEPLKDYMRDQELHYLNRTMAFTGGDKEKAAELLGISLATLYRKLAEEPPL